MENFNVWVIAIIVISPLITFTAVYAFIVFGNKQSTAEVKWILPPEMFLKTITMISIVSAVLIMGILRIISAEAISALIAGVSAGIIGVRIGDKNKDN